MNLHAISQPTQIADELKLLLSPDRNVRFKYLTKYHQNTFFLQDTHTTHTIEHTREQNLSTHTPEFQLYSHHLFECKAVDVITIVNLPLRLN